MIPVDNIPKSRPIVKEHKSSYFQKLDIKFVIIISYSYWKRKSLVFEIMKKICSSYTSFLLLSISDRGIAISLNYFGFWVWKNVCRQGKLDGKLPNCDR